MNYPPDVRLMHCFASDECQNECEQFRLGCNRQQWEMFPLRQQIELNADGVSEFEFLFGRNLQGHRHSQPSRTFQDDDTAKHPTPSES